MNKVSNITKLNDRVNEWSDVLYSYFKSKTSDDVYLIKTKSYLGESQKKKYLSSCYDNAKKKYAEQIIERYNSYKQSTSALGYMSFDSFADGFVRNKVDNFIFFAEPKTNFSHLIIKQFNKSKFSSYNGLENKLTTVRFSSVYMDNTDSHSGQASLYMSVDDIISHGKDGKPISKIPQYIIALNSKSMYVVDGEKLAQYVRYQKNVLNHIVCPLNRSNSYVEAIISYDNIGYYCNGNKMNIVSMPCDKDFLKANLGVSKMSKGGKTRKVIISIKDENGNVYEDTFTSLVQAAEGLSRSIGTKVSKHYISNHINKEEFIYVTKDTHKTLYISIIEVTSDLCSLDNNLGSPTKYNRLYNIYRFYNIYRYSNIFGRCTAKTMVNLHYERINI